MAINGAFGHEWPDLPIHCRHCFIVSGLSEDAALAEVKRQIDRLCSS